ncbi:Cyclin-D4-1 [Apostasia shenzhenica]|uniref:Cyclin-D4-1 n=1 Tax=Apostasia shenzhenica TaxID=1088818 RepID=A0A2I0AVD4_9ASPA|nr:Cyclin-D4-1 [Apostasia shenzhenica]
MGVSYDFASSILLCAEENSSIFGFDDDEDLGVTGRAQESRPSMISQQKTDFFGDPFMVLPLQSEECLLVLLERESEHLPGRDYAKRLISGALDISVRKDAVDWIRKVHAYYSFGPLTAYLSINYLDRFLSAYDLPQGNTWMSQLLAVACLSLAAKMEETEVPLSLDLQIGNGKYVFEAKTIQRMELLVLSTLNWRMQSVTPFSFIDFFLHKFNDGNSPKESEINCCVDLILNMITGISILEFKPSVVAAAVTLTALGEAEMVFVKRSINSCPYLEKEILLKCCEAIRDMRLMEEKAYCSVSSMPPSPSGVLDAKCLSYRSDEAAAGSQANSQNSSPTAKKRKLN